MSKDAQRGSPQLDRIPSTLRSGSRPDCRPLYVLYVSFVENGDYGKHKRKYEAKNADVRLTCAVFEGKLRAPTAEVLRHAAQGVPPVA